MVERSGPSALRIALLCSLILSVAACALYPTGGATPVVKTCSIPADQSGTISGRWPVTPIPIAYHQSDFDDAEMADISAAADTWNKFYTGASAITVIDTGDGKRQSSTTNPAASGSLCATGLVPTNQFIGNVTIYKQTKWPASYAASAIALTSFCVLPSKPFPRMYMAIMEVNYQNFFIDGQKQPDLRSILLHELGHLNGANHSCEGFQKSGTPNCSDPNMNPDYSAASMFPVFTFDQTGAGQVKRDLGTNDQSRANCLYGTSAIK